MINRMPIINLLYACLRDNFLVASCMFVIHVNNWPHIARTFNVSSPQHEVCNIYICTHFTIVNVRDDVHRFFLSRIVQDRVSRNMFHLR